MYKVEVFRTVGSKQELFFYLTYDEKLDIVNFHNVPDRLVNKWENFGIPYGPGKRVFKADGLKFLRAVSNDFNGSMVRSSNVEKNDAS